MNSEPDAIRVLVADRRRSIRLRFCRLIESAQGIQVVAEAEAAAPAVELARKVKPHVLLADHDLLRDCEPELIRETDAAECPLKTIATVTGIERAEVIAAFLCGAHGVVLKTAGPRQLRRSIRCVMAGRYWLGAKAVSILIEALREIAGQSPAGNGLSCDLTARELDVVDMVASGRSNKEVSEELCISERTVKHHLTSIFGKVGVTSRLELALFAINHLKHKPLSFSRVD